jgi:hypothetical protein
MTRTKERELVEEQLLAELAPDVRAHLEQMIIDLETYETRAAQAFVVGRGGPIRRIRDWWLLRKMKGET